MIKIRMKMKVKMLIVLQKCAGEIRQCASSDAFWRKTMWILVRSRWPKCWKLLIEVRAVGTGGGHRGYCNIKWMPLQSFSWCAAPGLSKAIINCRRPNNFDIRCGITSISKLRLKGATTRSALRNVMPLLT